MPATSGSAVLGPVAATSGSDVVGPVAGVSLGPSVLGPPEML